MKKYIPLVVVRLAAMSMIFAIVAPGFALPVDAKDSRKALTDDQKVIHVLNRLGFGARPGDVEKVKAMGIQKYIEQQLNPTSIDDTVAEQKVAKLEVFNMTTAEVFAKYPNPGALLKALEGKDAKAGQKPASDAGDANAADVAAQRKERQQKLREYYREYNLRPASQLLPQITANRVLRAVYSERQLQEVMVDFWQNHFNVFSGKNAVKWYIPSYERDVLRKYALGNFRDLLVGTAEHPAMLFFLDNYQSVAPAGESAENKGNKGNGRLQQMLREGALTPQMRERIKQRRGITDAQLDQRLNRTKNTVQKRSTRGINENYARELMELHTMGVDSGYTQKDIIEVARAFTGWTIADPRGYRRSAASTIQGTEEKRLDRLQRQAGVPDDIESGEFYFNEKWHDKGPKMVLGQKIDAGGMNDGLKVIDILVKSPATAKFIARKLAVKFVSDNPSDALVGRVAAAFTKSDGDIKSTLRALFSDKEFFAPETYRAKIKTPFELAISAIRTIGADTNSSPAVRAMLNKLGEVPYGYQAPTGYPDMAEDWVNTGALLERLNFAVALASNQIPGTHVDLTRFNAGDRAGILNKTIAVILDNDISAASKAALVKQIERPLPDVKPPTVEDEPDAAGMANTASMADTAAANGNGARRARNRQTAMLPPSGDAEVFKVVSLVLGTPEFQRQ